MPTAVAPLPDAVKRYLDCLLLHEKYPFFDKNFDIKLFCPICNEEAYIKKCKGGIMDKKMHQVSERMKTAEHDIAKGKKKRAMAVLKKAVKKNEKLKRYDRDVRDPEIKEYKKMKKKGC